MTTPENIEEAVQIVGEVLGDHAVGDTTSRKLAQEYVDYEQQLGDEVVSRNGYFAGPYFINYNDTADRYKESSSIEGKFGLVLWDWDDEFQFQLYFDDEMYVNQSGAAAIRYGYEDSPAVYYMALGGVENMSYDLKLSASGYSDGEKTGLFLPLYNINFMYQWTQVCVEESTQPYAVELLYNSGKNFGHIYFQCQRGRYPVNGYYIWTYVRFGQNHEPDTYIYLGEERFPYAIAASQKIKNSVESSKADNMSLYKIRPYGFEVPGVEKPYPSSEII
jgi:hypothetical protein